MAARKSAKQFLPDDITILNASFYPESLPPALVERIRKSRECQKRLEELIANKKIGRTEKPEKAIRNDNRNRTPPAGKEHRGDEETSGANHPISQFIKKLLQ